MSELCHRCTTQKKEPVTSFSGYIPTSSNCAAGSRTKGGSKPQADTQLQRQELTPQLGLLVFTDSTIISTGSMSRTCKVNSKQYQVKRLL